MVVDSKGSAQVNKAVAVITHTSCAQMAHSFAGLPYNEICDIQCDFNLPGSVVIETRFYALEFRLDADVCARQ